MSELDKCCTAAVEDVFQVPVEPLRRQEPRRDATQKLRNESVRSLARLLYYSLPEHTRTASMLLGKESSDGNDPTISCGRFERECLSQPHEMREAFERMYAAADMSNISSGEQT